MHFISKLLPSLAAGLSLIAGISDAAVASSLNHNWRHNSTINISDPVSRDTLQAQFPPLPPSRQTDRSEDWRDCMAEDDRDDRQDCFEDLENERERFADRENVREEAQDCLEEDDGDDRRDCLEDLREDYRDSNYDDYRYYDDGYRNRNRSRPDFLPPPPGQILQNRRSAW